MKKLLTVLVLLSVVGTVGANAVATDKKKLRIFLLAGQSNMTGYSGIMPLTNLANYQELDDPALRELDKRLCKVVFPGAEAIQKNHKLRAGIYKLLVEKDAINKHHARAKKDKDEQAVKKLVNEIKELNARLKELEAQLQVAKAKRVYIAPDGRYGHKPGVLSFGYGRSSNYMGPEYGFGLTLEQKLDAPILLIKVAQDGASLAYEYRPPSSGPYEPTAAEKKRIDALTKKQAAGKDVKMPDYTKAGVDFRRTVEFTREVLANLKDYHPEYDPAVGYDLAGFVWFQGWTDNHRPEYRPHYAQNMTNLIKDLRTELGAPNMLVVSGTPSYDRTEDAYEAHPVVLAQRAVGQMPEFKGNVTIVETLQYYDQPIWPLWPKWKEHYPEWHMVGSHVACHYLGSGRFFVRLGDALSTAMVEMMKQPRPGQSASGVAGGQTTSPLATRAADLAGNFPSPPHSAKTGVFWFWVNGNITREGITADLEAMARVGIGRVVLFEVSGDIPEGSVRFLSDEWRALFSHALNEATRLGMKLNINNDAGWCGSGGPWNTPENSMQQLVSTRTSVEGGKPFDAVLPQPPAVKGFYRDIRVLATKAIPAGDDPKKIWPRSQALDLTSKMDASGQLRWDPPVGTWDILRIGHTSTGKDNHPAPESGCGPECDKLSKAAVKAHFDGMMAKLITDAGPLAGKTLEHTHIDSWEVGTQNWTPALREEFQHLRGYDPLPFLPGELGYIVDDAETNRRFQWDMRVTISDLMLENYAGYFRSLAAQHGLTLSIEAYGAHPGHCPVNNLSYAGRADMPIGEFWIGTDNFRSCKEMASASHVYGKRLTGAEAFTAWPDNARFQFHPGNIKALGDRSFCVGVNRLMLHCYTHQPWLDRAPGMTMQGWGTHFERTQTWWEQSKGWHTYIARCQYLLQSGLFAADLCYLDVEDAPRDAPYPLGPAGYDYDVCPAEVVKNRMSVKDGRITLPDGMSYRLLVLPPSESMTPETLRRIVDLAKAGAVIAATKIPCRSPGLQNYPECDAEVKALARELFGDQAAVPATSFRELTCGAGRVFLGGELTQVLAALGVRPDVSIAGGGKDKRFSWVHRRTADADFYFISNQLAREEEITCTFRASRNQPELWHPETGMISALPVYQTTADGRIDVPLKFEPDEAFFVVFRKGSQKVTVDGAQKPGRNWRKFIPAQKIDGAWKVTFEPKRGGPEKTVAFEALTDWSSHTTEGIKFYSGTAIYQKTVDVDPAVSGLRPVFLDLGRVEVMAEVKLNGQELGTLWKKPFRIDVTGHLKPGANDVEIRVVNLWCNRLIGDQQLREDAEWKDGFMGWGGQFQILKSWPQWLKDGKPSPSGRFTFSTASYYNKGDALLPSGLLGPVQLLKAE